MEENNNIKAFKYIPQDICAKEIIVVANIEEKTIVNVSFLGGCNGNHKGIEALIKGMSIDEAADKLSGIECGGRGTSCPDQLSIALKRISNFINKENKENNV